MSKFATAQKWIGPALATASASLLVGAVVLSRVFDQQAAERIKASYQPDADACLKLKAEDKKCDARGENAVQTVKNINKQLGH